MSNPKEDPIWTKLLGLLENNGKINRYAGTGRDYKCLGGVTMIRRKAPDNQGGEVFYDCLDAGGTHSYPAEPRLRARHHRGQRIA